MDARTNIKARLPSRHVTEGPARAPHRSYYYAMGLTTEQIHQPFVGVASCWNEATPCNDFTLSDVAEVFKKTPYIADLKPAGRYVAKDMFEVGGIPLLMKTLLDNGFLHGDCMTVTGRTIAENLKSVKSNPNQDVVRPANDPITVTGGVVGLKGNLAPEGAIVKVAALLRDGDMITIDAVNGTIDVALSDEELERRRAGWTPCETDVTSGYLWKYAQQVGPAVNGAITHPGGKAEKISYADS